MRTPRDPSDDGGAATPRVPSPDLFATLFDGAESLIPFASAVTNQLAAQPGAPSGEAILGEVADLLQQAVDPDEELPVDRLAANTALLASFFQNADLLDGGAPETAVIARLVMATLEQLGDGDV